MVKFVPLNRVDRQIALLLLALISAFYLRMAAPDVLAGDPGEFHFAAWNFGLAHPTGYPLYMLVGGLWQHLWALVGVAPARALNGLSAVTGAVAVAVLFLLVRRWLPGSLLISRGAALVAALILAVNPTMWSQSLIAEVYALHALFIVLIFFAAQSIQVDRAHGPVRSGRYLHLFFLVGLALTHHGMTLLLLPGLFLFLHRVDRGWWRAPVRTLGCLAALVLPLLLYLYIPLRSGPAASPWYHQPLGDGVLTLYDGSIRAFVDFITGRAISVGFLQPREALARMGEAFTLWRIHYNLPGLVLLTIGLGVLIARKERAVLALTVPLLILQQLFNLFYAIDDILVYYIPLYVVAAIWVGFAADFMAGGVVRGMIAADMPKDEPRTSASDAPSDDEAATAEPHEDVVTSPAPAPTADAPAAHALDAATADPRQVYVLIVFVVLLLLPLRILNNYRTVLDQSDAQRARANWEDILTAQPPQNAVLISNDRNEIVPLFYLQHVENRRADLTGLFPLIQPGAAFADIGATLDTALARAGTQPVYLIKPMDGLDVKFELAPRTPPLVQVLGPAATHTPDVAVGQPYGPLTLLGYDVTDTGAGLTVALHWRVDAPLRADYTTAVQLFDAAGEKVAQDDRPPGGVYYPTSRWKAGETLLDVHQLAPDPGAAPVELLVNLYRGPDGASLAPALRLPFAP